MQADITIPYAVADFAQLRERGYYYVDKTQYIVNLERYAAPVFLRPRRFGKSLLVSMLAYYYDLNAADRFERLFGGTYIGSHPTEEHNRYMVLRFDFSTLVVADTIEGLERNFNQQFCPELEGFVHGKASYNRFFEGFRFGGEDQVVTMLRNILSWIHHNNLPPLYILIDEYDNFTNQLLVSYKDPLYEEVTTGESFLRTFFKTIKAGIGEGTIRTCFCTGVLPVTMDDLTSGYNIAEILTLKPEFLEMLGFNHEETATYLRYVIDKYGEGKGNYEELWNLIVNNYDGYRFLPEARPLFNSTILSYFFKNFAELHGGIPQEMIDENLRTDVNWIRRLTLSMENAKEMLDALIIDNFLSYSAPDLRSKFNKQKFFDKHFYPVSLYHLGMTTLKSDYEMCLPNLTMRSIYMNYYNELNHISDDARKYAPVYGRFRENRLFEPLVENYFKEYLGMLPAQVFDKIHENFIRCSF
ncbi:MAG: AAA family ATPase, partial [Prevotellaceae bacterium]|nr:AAA family ATPase [Prevotellaceae bacterium]